MKCVNVGNRILNNYLIKIDRGWIAVDTGYAGRLPRFLAELQKSGINLQDIKYVFLTHAHDDHAGYLEELMQATSTTLVMDKLSPDRLLAGHNQWIGGCSGRFAKLFVSAMSLAGKGKHEFPVVKISETDNVMLWDEQNQFFEQEGIGLKIISLPGHTSDHIGLLTDDGVLFCGDACMNGFPSVKRNIIWIEDVEDYRQSWDAMIQSPAEVIYPSHGAPFPKQDLVKYRKYLDKIRLY